MLSRLIERPRIPMGVGALIITVSLLAAGPIATAQEPATAAAEESAKAPAPVTSSDPKIPHDQLKLLVLPLTKGELEVEAAAWRDLVKANVTEISQAEIDVKRLNEKATSTEANAVKATPSEGTAAAQADTEAQADAQKQKQTTLEDITRLREQRIAMTDRLNVVLDELEAKGGDVAEYRTYVRAISGLNVDVTDASATWTALSGWVTSEEGGVRWAWNIAKFLAILCAFWILSRFLGRATEHATSRWSQSSALLKSFLGKLVRQATMLVGLVVALSALEVNIGPILAMIGAAGFVIGLALQNTLGNFASGLMILAYRPFDVGDAIDAAGISGTVESMNLLSTHVKTFDNKHIIVPNNDIWGGVITNATTSETRRVDMTFGIGYEDNVDTAQQILERIVSEHELVLDDPPPTIKLNELGDSSVNFICRPWVKSSDYWTVYWDITKAVKQEFDREGISIPFPQRDVHVYQHSAEPAV